MNKTFIIFSCIGLLVLSCGSHKNESILSGKSIKSLTHKAGKNGLSRTSTHSGRIVMPEFFNKLQLPPNDDPKSIAILDEKQEQNFSINCKNDTTITCAEGTKIFIPANAFANDKNKTVNNVNFSVKEYYSKGDIILAGLTTHADKKMLESGGMVYLTAKNDESECHLKKEKNIELSFPTRKSKNGMQVFNGVKRGNTINWVLPKGAVPPPPQIIQFVPPVINDDIVEDVPMAIMDGEGDREVAEASYNVVEQAEPDVYDSYMLEDQPEFDGGMEAMKKFVTDNIKYPTYCKDNCIQGKVFVEFVVDEKGTVADARIKRGMHPELDKEAKRVVASFPQWKPGKKSGKNVKAKYILPVSFTLDCESSLIRIPNSEEGSSIPTKTVSRDEYVKDYVEKVEDIHEVEQDQLEYYVMSSAKLGWINCDRFVESQKTERLTVNETDKENTTVRLVFKRLKSVLGGSYKNGEFVFTGFPANESVCIVGFKKVGNKNFMAMQETTSNSKTISLSYKEVSLDELKDAVAKLNGVSSNLAKN